MRLARVIFLSAASGLCAISAVLYARDAVNEYRREGEWDKAIQEELGEERTTTGEMQEGQHVSDPE